MIKQKFRFLLCLLVVLAVGTSVFAKMNYDQKANAAKQEFKKLTEQIEALENRREQLKGRFELLVELKKEEDKAEIEKAKAEKAKEEIVVVMPYLNLPPKALSV